MLPLRLDELPNTPLDEQHQEWPYVSEDTIRASLGSWRVHPMGRSSDASCVVRHTIGSCTQPFARHWAATMRACPDTVPEVPRPAFPRGTLWRLYGCAPRPVQPLQSDARPRVELAGVADAQPPRANFGDAVQHSRLLDMDTLDAHRQVESNAALCPWRKQGRDKERKVTSH